MHLKHSFKHICRQRERRNNMGTSYSDTIHVRKGEELNKEGLFQFIRNNIEVPDGALEIEQFGAGQSNLTDRNSTRLNSSHVAISYAVFCLKKKIDTTLII